MFVRTESSPAGLRISSISNLVKNEKYLQPLYTLDNFESEDIVYEHGVELLKAIRELLRHRPVCEPRGSSRLREFLDMVEVALDEKGAIRTTTVDDDDVIILDVADVQAMQKAIFLDLLRPRLMQEIHNLFWTAATRTITNRGVAAYFRLKQQQSDAEQRFCNYVASALSVGISVEAIRNSIDDDPTYQHRYRVIYKAWVDVALLRAKRFSDVGEA